MSKTEHSSPASAQLTLLRSELIKTIRLNQNRQNFSTKTKAQTAQKVISPVKQLDTISVVRTLLSIWSSDHVLEAIYGLAEQGLMRYAKKRPYHLVGVALVLGAALVWVRPWRRLPKTLPATIGSIAVVKLYQLLMQVILKKP